MRLTTVKYSYYHNYMLISNHYNDFFYYILYINLLVTVVYQACIQPIFGVTLVYDAYTRLLTD